VARRPDVTLNQLRYFLEAATTLSMTQAAQNLLVAQSAVSSAVSQLERQIGCQLFVRRRSKGLTLTTAGHELLAHVRVVLAGLDEALDAARGADDQVRGAIRCACFVTLAPFVLADVLVELQHRHPHLEVEVIEVDADDAREALRAGRVELALCYDFGIGDDIRCDPVMAVPPHVLLPAGHPLAGRRQVRLRDLARERFILLDLPGSREYFLGLHAAVGVEPLIRHRSQGYETVRAMVARGLGYSILNARPRHDRTYGGDQVVVRAIADDVPALPFVVASLASYRSTARARAVSAAVHDVATRLLNPVKP
jgi:DNA-binding transcriptional LysR family regulator